MNKLFKISLIILTCLAGTSKASAEKCTLLKQNKSLYLKLINSSYSIIKSHLALNPSALAQFENDFSTTVLKPMHEFYTAWSIYQTNNQLSPEPPDDLKLRKLVASLEKIAFYERALSHKMALAHPGALATTLEERARLKQLRQFYLEQIYTPFFIINTHLMSNPTALAQFKDNFATIVHEPLRKAHKACTLYVIKHLSDLAPCDTKERVNFSSSLIQIGGDAGALNQKIALENPGALATALAEFAGKMKRALQVKYLFSKKQS